MLIKMENRKDFLRFLKRSILELNICKNLQVNNNLSFHVKLV